MQVPGIVFLYTSICVKSDNPRSPDRLRASCRLLSDEEISDYEIKFLTCGVKAIAPALTFPLSERNTSDVVPVTFVGQVAIRIHDQANIGDKIVVEMNVNNKLGYEIKPASQSSSGASVLGTAIGPRNSDGTILLSVAVPGEYLSHSDIDIFKSFSRWFEEKTEHVGSMHLLPETFRPSSNLSMLRQGGNLSLLSIEDISKSFHATPSC